MSTACPALGSSTVTAAAMRAAAALIEESGTTGLSVTCDGHQITIQVCDRPGGAAERAATVAALAALLGSAACQDDSPAAASSWLTARGQARGIPVRVYTPLAVTTSGPAARPLAITPGGHPAALDAGQCLPAGWRWATELDDPAATREEVA